MVIGQTFIQLPSEGTGDHPPDWRRVTAAACVESGISPSRVAPGDDAVLEHAQYLRFIASPDRTILPPSLRPQAAAAHWYAGRDLNSLRARLEPLLLTSASYRTIALDLGVEEKAVEVYEKTYFNSRNPDGTMQRSCFRRNMLAIDENVSITDKTPKDIVWRMTGFSMGYGALVSLWRWDGFAHGIDDGGPQWFDELYRMAQSSMLESVLRNRVSNFDLNNLIGNYVQHSRMMFDTQQNRSASSELLGVTLGLLQAARPRMLSAAREVDVETLDRTTEEIQRRLAAQRQIAGTKLPARNAQAGTEAINRLITANLAESTR